MTEREELLNRLSLIEGQVRGIRRMIEEERYCVDVLTQVAAVRAAMGKVTQKLLAAHTRVCVQQAVLRGKGNEAVDELLEVIAHIV